MSDGVRARGPSHRRIETGVAVAMIVLGLVVIAGSLRVGIGWGPEGPRSGFFPFYIGLAIIGCSAINLVRSAVSVTHADRLFAEWDQLRRVLSVVVPATVYVLAVPWTGLYLASIVLVAFFMVRLGRYSVLFSLAVAVAMMVTTYLVFERWFLVPLPKGPIEDMLGL
jgi:hypothetical protein